MLYEIYEPYEELGYKVMQNEPSLRWLLHTDVRIGFLRSFKPKKASGKEVLGECILANRLYEPFCPYDFLIVIYEENVAGLSDEQMYTLMHHELLHVGVQEKNGEMKYRVVPHDIEDFEEILSRYGTHWAKTESR